MTDQETTRTRDSDPLRLAPHSVEAEEAVLGAILMNPESLHEVAAFLTAEDFFIVRHGWIYEAILRLHERGDAIDERTVTEELRAQSRLEEIGGPAYIAYLFNSTPTALHAETYGHIVERAALRRRLLGAAGEIAQLAHDEERDINHIIDQAEAALFTVTERRLRQELVPMRIAMSAYFDRIERLREHKDEALGVPTGFYDLDKLLGGLQRGDLIIVAGRPGMGKCVAAGTLIPTTQGLTPIENLQPQGVEGIPDGEGGIYYPLEVGVQTPNGLRQTSYFYDSGIKPTLRLTTRAGYSLTGTHVHPVLVLSPTGEKAWKPLCELQCGEFVAIQRHEPVWGKTATLPDFDFSYYWSKRALRPRLPVEMTPELAYMLGLLAGDGGLTQKNAVSISSSDSEIIDAFYSWTLEMGIHPQYNANYDHRVGSTVLNAWLANIGLSGYAHEKEVPFTVLQASRECVRAFLQGLFDTDAHAEIQHGYIQFVSSSEKLAREVHLLLLQFGIVSKLTFKANSHKGAWLIRITGDAARLFYKIIGFRLERKQSRCALLPNKSNANLDVIPYLSKTKAHFNRQHEYTRYFRGDKSPSYPTLRQIALLAPEVTDLLEPEFYWDEIVQIEDSGLRHCYDLTVPEGHAFIANGIVSHNTSFLLTLALNAARQGDARIAIFSMEMSNEQLVQRLIASETGISAQDLRLGNIDDAAWARFVQAVGSMSNLKIFFDDSPAISAMQLRTKCRRLYREFGLDLVIVDYLQLMSAGTTVGRDTNRVQEITFISRSLKELARELNVPVLSAAQLSRAVEQRQDKRPQLSDLRESGSIEQDADIVLFLYRDDVYNEATERPNEADIIVAKHRNGPTGTTTLLFQKELTKFVNLRRQRVDLSDI